MSLLVQALAKKLELVILTGGPMLTAIRFRLWCVYVKALKT